MIIPLRYVGIDVSKQHLDIFDEGLGVPERIANAPQAITQIVARWRCDVLVVFEATGVYDLELREALGQAGIRFARINPARARDFARASGQLAKTDPIDARMLAAFARALKPVTEQAANPARNALARLAKRRDQLVLMRAQEKNRRSEADDRAMADRIGRLIEVLDGEIAEIEADISTLIKTESEISGDAQLIRSLPGVGPVTCMQLIAQMPELGKVGPKQVAALAGLAPFNVDSGAYRGKRKIAGGRKRVRDALYMAALNAVRRADPFKVFYVRLRQAGKPAKLALIAVARKLLTVLNAMMRDRKPYLNVKPT
ncbi:IS110 family transposase [Bradyrhizobium barranii subsp. barranii]|uniref:IS110 family transposase n=2 Tax=Bradyrhizobium TaxID=374 RepID=A0A7Z0QE57_9BRAD|nr:IS110 family transposase [Bradyrhizobium barranii]UGX91853.1 IS110 family transposase [Bradyrhizobium barranii subsp. barranii]UGX92849.1 IS110 family transposase [Bradyrhizobium barranii subsp. barranii]UGX93204.1 IS110 family transposase [Bradyrhizobium barranii subsp. barranii]UGX94712.1 IS110 family transposase [Bradyrhizobium barranii subsp. barranii]